ncbi:unnamed protein product [Prunus armeniaca]
MSLFSSIAFSVKLQHGNPGGKILSSGGSDREGCFPSQSCSDRRIGRLDPSRPPRRRLDPSRPPRCRLDPSRPPNSLALVSSRLVPRPIFRTLLETWNGLALCPRRS